MILLSVPKVTSWRRAVSFGQETRARSLHLAASDQGHRLADAGAALDAAGRDRLAASGAHLRAADGGVNRHAFFIHIFFAAWVFACAFFLRTQKVLAYCAHDDGAGGPSGSGHAEPRGFGSCEPLAAP